MAYPTNPTIGQTYTTPAGVTYIWTAQGAWRAVVPQPAPGNTDQALHAGSGAPNNTLGLDGDFYINTDTGMFYGPRAGGVWPSPATPFLGGADTISGNSSGLSPAGSLGANGDYFFDTSSGLMFGPKTSGVWPPTPVFNFTPTNSNFGVASGTTDALTVTLPSGASAYYNGMPIYFLAVGPNTTTSPTINVNGIGPIAIVMQNNSAPPVGSVHGLCFSIYYNGSARLLASLPATTTSAGLSRQATDTEATNGATTGPAPAFMSPEDVALYVAGPGAVATATVFGTSRHATNGEATSGVVAEGTGPAFVSPGQLVLFIQGSASHANATTFGSSREAHDAEATSGVTVSGTGPAFMTPEQVAMALSSLGGGSLPVATVSGYGVSRLATDSEATNGITPGFTPAFMSPEKVALYVAGLAAHASAVKFGTSRKATGGEATSGITGTGTGPAFMSPENVADAIVAQALGGSSNSFTASGVGASLLGMFLNVSIASGIPTPVSITNYSGNQWVVQIGGSGGHTCTIEDTRTFVGTWEVATVSGQLSGSIANLIPNALVTITRTA